MAHILIKHITKKNGFYKLLTLREAYHVEPPISPIFPLVEYVNISKYYYVSADDPLKPPLGPLLITII